MSKTFVIPDGTTAEAVASGVCSSAARPVPIAPRLNVRSAQAVAPPARPARARRRHFGLVLSFFLLVMLPMGLCAAYLYTRAADQYASITGFSVRKEEAPSASEMLGGVFEMTSGSSSDTDILYEFIQSQSLVERIDARLDLRSLYSRPNDDPVFAVPPDSTIEDLVRYWRRMVTVYYDGASGLIEIRVLAFDPAEAQAIGQAIFDECSRMINELTAISRADTTRHARNELEIAVERLKQARAAVTEFRTRTRIVDPNADIQGQMGLLTNLQAQLAEALINLDLLLDTTRPYDARVRQAEQRIEVIELRIAEEREKFATSEVAAGGAAYAQLVGEYEGLVVEREFAEKTYLGALANFDAAQAEAQRQSRYLAPYIRPTLAQSPEYPQREMLLGIVGAILMLGWSILALVYYSVRDRR